MNLKDVKDGWLNLFKSYFNLTKLSDEAKVEIQRRADTCQACPELKHTVVPESIAPLRFKCGQCNCFFPAVVFSPGHKCPLGKW